MATRSLIRDMDERKLRRSLVVLFVALAVPIAVLLWQAYGQLKWESFYQYRQAAETLQRRIDSDLQSAVDAADARSFADYSFLVVSGDPASNFVQQSPLAGFPPRQDIPGTLAYFQVDAQGRFSTPLLPPQGTDGASFGIGADGMESRNQLATSIRSVLAENALVSATDSRLDAIAATVGRMNDGSSLDAEKIAAKDAGSKREVDSSRQVRSMAEVAESAVPMPVMQEAEPAEDSDYDQAAFDRLESDIEDIVVTGSRTAEDQRARQSNFGLDESFERKTQDAQPSAAALQSPQALVSSRDTPARNLTRKEQTYLPDLEVAAQEEESSVEAVNLPITTFESEVDPLQISILNADYLVAYRNVWREGERLVQGMLIDSTEFLETVIELPFRESSLAGVSGLAVAWDGQLLARFNSYADQRRYASRSELTGTLLYRSRLADPLGRFELVFNIDSLPPGPGANVLLVMSLALAIVLAAGYFGLHRIGIGQIRLARQQQDFVSAVSHELKTPLTSIRMYGEMLKEGWAEESKRQTYYEFIHDESERLTRLINNVLQLSRISRNEPQFDQQEFGADELLDLTESKLVNQVERAGFGLIIERPVPPLRLLVDADSFLQIMINLVDNAIKFSTSSDRKEVLIRCRSDRNQRVIFEVRDFGPGIEKSQLKKIFRMFYRPESELTRESVGTGIGLAIVQQLTEAMGGKVDVANADPGALFTLHFPAAPRAPSIE